MAFCAIVDFVRTIKVFDSFNCGICWEEKGNDDRLTIKGCSHFYCSDCICKYIASKLELKIVRIRCPKPLCSGQLDPQHCRSIIELQVFDKWNRALCTQACKKYAPEKGDIMLHKLARTMGWKQCPGCNIYIEKSAQKRQWSVEEAELDPAYKVQFVLDEILDESSEFCNSMNCGLCGCHFCYNCGVSYDDPKGHDSRREKCWHAYVPPLIANTEKVSTRKSADETSTRKKTADEKLTINRADETSTVKTVPSPWWKGVQVTYFSDCKDISEVVANGSYLF